MASCGLCRRRGAVIFEPGDRYRDSPAELYADAFSALITEPETLKATAPTFHSVLFNYLGRKPEVQALYEAIQARIAKGPKAILDTRIDSASFSTSLSSTSASCSVRSGAVFVHLAWPLVCGSG